MIRRGDISTSRERPASPQPLDQPRDDTTMHTLPQLQALIDKAHRCGQLRGQIAQLVAPNAKLSLDLHHAALPKIACSPAIRDAVVAELTAEVNALMKQLEAAGVDPESVALQSVPA